MKTNKPLETYSAFDIVIVPFPFVDAKKTKHRPALVLSSESHFNTKAGSSVLAMITSSSLHPWPLDYTIKSWEKAGLPVQSLVRMKLFTLDHRLILYKLGRLTHADQVEVRASLEKLF